MIVLSLFDGISCGRVALERAKINVTKYYASEIDKFATQVSENNYPDIIRLGDVNNWRKWDIDFLSIDLIIAGSPCVGFSVAGKRQGTKAELDGVEYVVETKEQYLYLKNKVANFLSQSHLFWEFVCIKEHIQQYNYNLKFLLENVQMNKEIAEMITRTLEVKPVMINSALVSAQNRKRLYWANWHFAQPEDKGILLKDILQDLPDCPSGVKIREKSKCVRVGGLNSPLGSKQEWDFPYQLINKKGSLKKNQQKASCLTGGAHSGGNHSDMDILHTLHSTRRYSVIECERLQTLHDNYTDGVSNTQRYKMLGNGWTVDVIAHILKSLKKEMENESN